MKVKTNVTRKERKQLVNVIGELLEAKPEYQGMPSAAYKIKNITVTKTGELVFDELAKSEIELLLEGIMEAGYEPEVETEDATKETGLTVTLPLDAVGVGNLRNLLDAKSTLIKKALGIKETSILIEEDRISFSWFSTIPAPDEMKAYTHFISAICKMSKEQKRISATEKEVDNEKYAFRCFLLRLGFIGEEYKEERKILLRNLTGSAAFKTSGKNEVPSDEISK